MHGVLFPLFGSRIIKVIIHPHRNGHVLLLNSGAHFPVELLLQTFHRLEHGSRVAVFGPKVLQNLWIAFLTQPEERVISALAVLRNFVRLPWGKRRVLGSE